MGEGLTAVEIIVARGVERGLKFWAGGLFLLAFLVWGAMWALEWLPIAKDDTDPDWGRSQMAIRYDCGTGLQYLVAKGGGITPRLDREGNHMTWVCR